MPTLRIATLGSDFRDTCTSLKNFLDSLANSDVRYETTRVALNSHLEEAKGEFRTYKQCQDESRRNAAGNINHLVFDFAEKVLLPKLQKQLGQLHFITGLKFDLFGVSSSNLGRNFVFELPEGHWPNEKTANSFISMLDYIISYSKQRGHCAETTRHLKLHADNCAGQNKNRFLMWYLAWRVLVELEDEITLYFLVAGHTKNVCDGSFGHVNRRLLTSDVITPNEMIAVIEQSSASTTCVPSTHVHWRDWKALLGQYFTGPKSFKITQGHVFWFVASEPWTVRMKSLSTSTEEQSFNLKQRGLPGIAAEHNCINDMTRELFEMPIVPLKDVYSKQHLARENYLKVNILDRYYESDGLLRRTYFQDGSHEIYKLL